MSFSYHGLHKVRNLIKYNLLGFVQKDETEFLLWLSCYSLLFRSLKENNKAEMYCFVDPLTTSSAIAKLNERAKYLAYAILRAQAEQLVGVPYNPG